VVSLDAITQDVVEALRILADERGLKLTCQLAPAQVRGDAAQLRNAIANVLDNALRHTPGGGSVSVVVSSDVTHVRIAIEDSGRGLSPDQLERVFERFYSERRTAAGGLGLPIARAIAVAHGGTLRASSSAGARFEMRIPLAQI
jgi:signal transduction histidine kinase